MSFKTDRIEAAAQAAGVEFRRLDPQDAADYRIKINSLYTDREHYESRRCRLFESFPDIRGSAYVNWENFEIWNPSNFIKTSTVLVFFDVWHHPQDENVWYVFPNGEKVGKILNESASGTHYYTDFGLSYLIAYAEEEIIYGVGEATEWAKSVYEQLQDTERNRNVYTIEFDLDE